MSARTNVVGLLGSIMFLSACGLTAPPPTADVTSTPTNPPSATQTPEEAATPIAADFSAAEQSALRIRNVGCGGVATGSGFAVSDHVLVTNRHVVGGASILQISTYDGHDITVDASGATNVADLAFVLTDQKLPRTIPIAKTNPAVGDRVTAVGYPSGGELTTTQGRVLGYDIDPIGWSSLPMLVNDAPIEHGSSGSPLLNAKGELVGIVYATEGDSGRQFAVPVEVLNDLINTLDDLTGPTNCDGLPTSEVPQDATKCSDNVYAGDKTSCPFALEVERVWGNSGRPDKITAHSPVTDLDYQLVCQATGPTLCMTEAGATVYIK